MATSGSTPADHDPADRDPGDRDPGDRDPADHDPADHDPASRDPADLLAELLENAPPEARREITAWLLSHRPAAKTPPAPPGTIAGLELPWLSPSVTTLPTSHSEIVERVHRLAGQLPAGTDSQLVTLRLPADRHAALREWCAAHGFSMAAVVRGLVERFLEEQATS